MRIPARCVIVVALLSAPVTKAAGQAEAWREPYPVSDANLAAGGYLEQIFRKFVTDCGINPSKWAVVRRFQSDQPKSTVPLPLQTAIGSRASLAVEDQWNHSLAKIFAYVYRPEERTAPPQFDADRIIDLNLVADAESMVPEGSSDVAYQHSCSSLVNLTLDARTGFQLPVAAIEAGVQAEHNAQGQALVTVAEGIFQSPLETMIVDGGLSRLAAYFLLWDWYHKAKPTAGEENYYLRRFAGIAAAYQNRIGRSFTGTLDMEGEVAVAFADVRTQAEVSRSEEVKLKVNQHSTAAYQGTSDELRREDSDFAPVPPLAEVIEEIEALARPQQLSADVVIVRGGEHLYRHRIAGVPRGVCRGGYWRATGAPELGELTLLSAEATRSQEIDVCDFLVRFKPAAELFDATGAGAALEYAFTSDRPGFSGALTIPIPTISLSPSTSPDLRLAPEFRSTPSEESGIAGGVAYRDYSWEVPLTVFDEGDPVNWARSVIPSSFTLSCPGEEGQPVPLQVVLGQRVAVAPGESKLVLELGRHVSALDGRDFEASKAPCLLSGGLTFSMGNNRAVDEPLPSPIKLLYPPRMQAPSPVDVPAPGEDAPLGEPTVP